MLTYTRASSARAKPLSRHSSLLRHATLPFLLSAITIATSLSTEQSAFAENVISNGSFETPVVTPPHLNFSGSFTFGGWTGYSTGNGTTGMCGIVSGPASGNRVALGG